MLGLFFFFQAEDGIRDTSVTGVQTCALPISKRPCNNVLLRPLVMTDKGADRRRSQRIDARIEVQFRNGKEFKIGRASCRERVKIWVDAKSLKKEKKIKIHVRFMHAERRNDSE